MAEPRIDVHFHYLPDFYRSALIAAGFSHADGIARLPDWSERDMIETMDRLGIERAYLSISSPGVHFGDDGAARDLARRVNEEAARLKSVHSGRIEFFASTPLPDIDGAVAEIAHAIDTLGASGVVFESHFHGIYLGDDRLEPVLAELDRRRAVLFVHPTTPGISCGCGGGTPDFGYPAPMMEFVFDTTRTFTNMVLSGTFERHRELRIILPHAGAALPILAGRIDLIGPMLAPEGAAKPPSMREALKCAHFDLAGTPVPELLGALLSVADPNHIHYGSDWPYTPTPVCEKLAAELDGTALLDGPLRSQAMRRNSERLFAERSDTHAPQS
ncbi:amidohydrolase [Sphingomonas sp. CGMCC 1.13654]|uniref:6-methylsalicylate decarboxylase n=1 Tax=Sphingomonas chungangi TaxID=2683589 RepID=A0A838L3K9_9SPHN|nr:amidohydrolase family protein [Sphingomonas chungangi]MBA2933510.1 amidohydrolase [Sphingomonas chungangi]MVW54843.1 amidohydrolase family protein [Sphingomonas chungangi]